MKDLEERKKECAAVNAALPSNSYNEIVERLNKKNDITYSFVYRVLNVRFKQWTPKHAEVLKVAKSIIKEKQKALK